MHKLLLLLFGSIKPHCADINVEQTCVERNYPKLADCSDDQCRCLHYENLAKCYNGCISLKQDTGSKKQVEDAGLRWSVVESVNIRDFDSRVLL